MGGSSSEREISLESGRHVYNMLDEEKYEPVPMFMDSEHRFWVVPERLVWLNTTADIEVQLAAHAEEVRYEDLKKKIDFAFLALHGKFVEDGSLQGLLEILEIPYNGSGVLTSALGMDKFYQRKLLRAAGLEVPKHIGVQRVSGIKYQVLGIDELGIMNYELGDLVKLVEKELGWPCVVKPAREGCSTALAIVKNERQLEKALKEALGFDNVVLIEEDLSKYLEVTTTVLGNEEPVALLPTHTPHKKDYLTVEEKFLPGDAQMITPPKIAKEEVKKIQEETVKAYKALGCKVYSRIDGFWTRKKLIVLEPNTLPGITPSTMVFHQAAEAGMTPTDFFSRVIELSLEAHEDKKGAL